MTQQFPDVCVGAVNDQYDAALRHTHDMQRTLCEIVGGAVSARVRPAVAVIVGRHVHANLTGLAESCPHAEGSPRPLLAAAWAPGVEACAGCAPVMLAVDADEEHRCDGCRMERPGGVRPGVAGIGLVTLQYGLCVVCFEPTTTPAWTVTR